MTEQKNVKAKESAKSFSQEEVDKLIREAVGKVAVQQSVVVKAEEKVLLLYAGLFAPGTVVNLEKLGIINNPFDTLEVGKKEFLQNITPLIRTMLENRNLIVLEGLTETERKRYGVNYKEDETLSQDLFYSLWELDEDKKVAVFEKLCDEHKKIVAGMYIDEWTTRGRHSNEIYADTVEKMNRASKSVNKNGMFKPIIDDFAERMKG